MTVRTNSCDNSNIINKYCYHSYSVLHGSVLVVEKLAKI